MNDSSDSPENNQTLRDYVRVIFRQSSVVLTSIVVIMTVVFIGLKFNTHKYEASVKMLVSGEKQVDSPYYKELITTQDDEINQTQSAIVTSTPVLSRVVDALHLDKRPVDYERTYASPLKCAFLDLEVKMYQKQMEKLSASDQITYNHQRAIDELRTSIKVDPVKDTNIFTIKIKDYDPTNATIIANVISRSYVIYDLEQQMAELQQKYGDQHPMVVELQDSIKQMTLLLSGQPISDEEALGTASVKIIEQASIPIKPSGPPNKLIFLAALFASIFMGFFLAFLFEYMDQTIKSPKDVEKVLGIPLFATIPIVRSIKRGLKEVAICDNMIFRNLANQLRLMMTVKSFKIVMVTASGKHEGTSTLVANLGIYAAHEEAKKVLIIDANFYHPAMSNIFDVSDSPGFVDVLTEQASLEKAIICIQPTLFVLPAANTTINPLIFLDSPKTRAILEKLKSQFDLILIDCVDLNSTQEACLLAPLVDKIIFVVSENQTRRPVALRALENLKEHKASILGAILNKRTYPIPKFIYNRV